MRWPRKRRAEGQAGRRGRRFLRFRTLFVLALLVIVGTMTARLAAAPYDSVWLGRIVTSLLEQRSRGATISVAALRVDFSGTAPTPLTLLDVAVSVNDEAFIAEIPEIRIATRISEFLSGTFRVGRIRAMRPEVEITTRKNAALPLPSAAELAETTDKVISAAIADFMTFGIDGVEIEDAGVAVEGPVRRHFDTIDMTITPSEDRALLQIDASVAGRAGRWTLRFRHGADTGTAGRWFSLAAADVTVADFLPADYPVRAGRGLGLPLFPQATFHLDKDGVFRKGEMRLGVGAGYLALHEDEAVVVDEMLLALSWTPDNPAVVVEPSYAIFGQTRFTFRGQIRPPGDGTEKWQFALEAPHAQIKPRDVKGPPLIIERILAFGSFDAAKLLLDVDTLNVRAGPLGITAAGSVEYGPQGPILAAALSANGLTVGALKRLWPPIVANETRDWFVKHAQSGQFTGGRLSIALDRLGFDGDPATVGWSSEGFNMNFSVDHGSLRTLGELPPLQDLKASGEIRRGRFSVRLEHARVEVPGGGQVTVGSGIFTIPDLRPADKTGQLELSMRGAASDIARLAGTPPIDGAEKLGLRPDGLTGKADATVSVSFPIRSGFDPIKEKQVSWTVAATLSDFSSRDPIAGQTVKNADLDVTANAAAAILRGHGVINGVPVEIDFMQPLEGPDGSRNQDLMIDFDAADLAAKGIDLSRFVSGKLRLKVDTAADGERKVDADLSHAELRVPAIGWVKAAGVPARARFTVRDTGKGQSIEDFRLTSEGVDVVGQLMIDKNGALAEADFSRFALRRSDSGRLSISHKGDHYTVDFSAENFDGRGLIANLKRGGDDGESARGGEYAPPDTNLTFNARIDRLTGFNDAAVTSFAAHLDLVDRQVTSLDLSGLVDGRDNFKATLGTRQKQRTLHLEAGDAGGLFRFFDLYQRLKGGRLVLNAALPVSGEVIGQLRISDLTITEDPAIKQIVNAEPTLVGSDSSAIVRRRSLDRGDMSFQTLDVRFRKSGEIVSIESGALRGPVLGGALDGKINLATQALNLKGTFVPAYALNNLFGRIPLLGQLVGGRNGGLLGVTFRIAGTMDSPVVSVNPMSAIAPGIFRKMFEYN